MNVYDDDEFNDQMQEALVGVARLLESTRHPKLPSDVPHRYDDKYLLAEFIGRVSIASTLQTLELVGLSADGLARLRAWAKTRSVTLRLAVEETCRFDREEDRRVESPEIVTETRGTGGSERKSSKIVTTIKEYFWRFDFKYVLLAYQGNTPEDAVALLTRSGGVEIKTATKQTPRPKSVVRDPIEVDVSWLLRSFDAEGRVAFVIDRADPKCHTPRRNPQIEQLFTGYSALHAWCEEVCDYFVQGLFGAQQEHGLDVTAIDESEAFVPVLPLFEEGGDSVLPADLLETFLAEERRSLGERLRALAQVFPRDATVITAVEAGLLYALHHAMSVAQAFSDGVDHVEDMLRKQLVAAIGKHLGPADFDAYMQFHHRKLVRPEFWPKPFSYAIRRPDHDPEGVVSVEASRSDASDPVSTTVARSVAQRPMYFGLDASTRVAFLGDRFLHAWVGHRFSTDAPSVLSLVARARQFSSFILMVGRLSSADTFEPKHAIIVQNKDVLKIPLMLETLPTPKEFRDAIESLSPEQQRFAKAFRGMQLESTLFAVAIVHIKPQLEKLLKLPDDSLTKEIKLTQELLGLFMEYQIPSDLLSYDGPTDAPVEAKLARVKEYAARMHEMIALQKQKQLQEEQEREALRVAEMNRTMQTMAYAAAPMGGGFGGPPQAPGLGRGGPPPGMGPPPPAMSMAMPFAPPPAPAPTRAAAPVTRAKRAAPPRQMSEVLSEMAAPELERAEGSASAPESPAAAAPATAPRGDAAPAEGGDAVDYTRIPAELDRKFEALDEDAALRATIITPGPTWERTSQKGLLSPPVDEVLREKQTKTERNKAFDLLDALSKSGALAIEEASLHVVLAATHAFDKTLLETVIQDNVNPIEKVERSLMIVGTTIHGRPASELLMEGQRDRFFSTSPKLRSSPSQPGLAPAAQEPEAT